MEGRAPSTQETWDAFFSDFYLRAYGGLQRSNETREQALAAARLAGCPPGGDLLDVPCGFGRHSVVLAQEGYRVTGVDRAEPLLDEARRRAGDSGAEPAFVHADYRKLPFPDGSFDGALNLFSSIGYLGDEEDTHVLAEIARVLRPGARLVLELVHRDQVAGRFQERDWRLLGEGRLLLEQRTYDPAHGVVQSTQTLIERTGERESRTFSVRVYAATELVAMLQTAGFGDVACYGGFDATPLAADSRLVIAARR